jgi:hypothetical protein
MIRLTYSLERCAPRRGQERCARSGCHSGQTCRRRGSKRRTQSLFCGTLVLFTSRIRPTRSVSGKETTAGRIQSP